MPGWDTDARLAPTPGPNLFYQIGTYLYQLDVNPGRSAISWWLHKCHAGCG
jgi:hypothetical protein